MKEHRVRALRVTTTSSIKGSSGVDVEACGSLQLLQLELELRCTRDGGCSRVPHHTLHHGTSTDDDQDQDAVLRECAAAITIEDFFRKPDHDELSAIKAQKGVSLLGRAGIQDAYDRLYDALVAGESCAGQLALQLAAVVGAGAGGGCGGGGGAAPAACVPLLAAACRRLLRDSAFPLAAAVARVAAAAVCRRPSEAALLLAASVGHLDDAADLTRELLHAGAPVWGGGGPTEEDSEDSTFAAFLRAVMRRRRLDSRAQNTLHLLSEAMGEQPARMHRTVMRTMFRHARCVKVLGPVFLQLKSQMKRYWTQPLELRFLCRKAIRGAVGPQRLAQGGAAQLGLPPPLQKYVCFELQ
ncbi:uncharacterized protein LOC126284297 isoform X1 [Schistocerca gregaria]|uniref:uncharacterized protein LOC126284297 isoform X1 n=2 Tax=Schistocerca TaxID=7008 RepID=UPI00211E2D61|nr:uncharacterized protein LOC126284297 isoform X1 [Schistocerca gregaria]